VHLCVSLTLMYWAPIVLPSTPCWPNFLTIEQALARLPGPAGVGERSSILFARPLPRLKSQLTRLARNYPIFDYNLDSSSLWGIAQLSRALGFSLNPGSARSWLWARYIPSDSPGPASSTIQTVALNITEEAKLEKRKPLVVPSRPYNRCAMQTVFTKSSHKLWARRSNNKNSLIQTNQLTYGNFY